jgi:hypothetical protein
MTRITEATTIGVDAETLWREVGDFGSVGKWHPMLESVETNGQGPGATRIAHGKTGGGDQLERLQTSDPRGHLYRYTLEQTPMPVRNYTGEFRIDPAGDSSSTVTWSADFELVRGEDPETVESVRQFLHAGVQSLERQFGNQPRESPH